MTDRIDNLLKELRFELKRNKIKLVLRGDKIILVKDKVWDDTYLYIDTRLQHNVQFDFPVY